MYEMLTGSRCFVGGDNVWMVQQNVINRNTPYWPSNIPLSEMAQDFLDKLLEVEPLKRFSCEEALSHPWLASIRNQQQSIHPQMPSPLTPLQNAVQSDDSTHSNEPNHAAIGTDAFVIKTSQSMKDLSNLPKMVGPIMHRRKMRLLEKRKQLRAQRMRSNNTLTLPNRNSSSQQPFHFKKPRSYTVDNPNAHQIADGLQTGPRPMPFKGSAVNTHTKHESAVGSKSQHYNTGYEPEVNDPHLNEDHH